MSKEKKKSTIVSGIEALEAKIEAEFGKGTIQRLNKESAVNHPALDTGVDSVNKALGINGIALNRSTEISGPTGGGKTTFGLTVTAQTQRSGGHCVYIDFEHALDVKYAAQLGVDLDELLLCQPNSAEEGINILQTIIESKYARLVVVDSVAAMTPQVEAESDVAEAHMGLHARLMARMCRKIHPPLANSNCALLFINQIRHRIGVMYGSPETTTGGKSLPFFASMRIDIRPSGKIEKNGEHIGNKVKFKVIKNRMAVPYKEAECDLIFGAGFDSVSSVINGAIGSGKLVQAGSWYSIDGERIGQGKDAVKDYLLTHPDVYERLKSVL